MKKLLTLCVVVDGSRLLLGMKKRGFGEGRWNGFGGKVQPGETLETAAQRELQEEAGIEALRLEHAGVMHLAYHGNPYELEVHVYRCEAYRGEPAESEEMRPAWFDADALPYDAMWENDPHWYPAFLARTPFDARFDFDADVRLRHHEVSPLIHA